MTKQESGIQRPHGIMEDEWKLYCQCGRKRRLAAAYGQIDACLAQDIQAADR